LKRSSKVGFAVVGLGNIAQSAVLPAFCHSRRARLVALVSGDKKKATRLAHKFGADSAYSYEHFTTCLADPDVNAVYIATPQGQHEPFAVEAAAAGKHILCEKPLAATVEQALRMIADCRKHNVLLMTAYRKFFEPSTVYLKKLIRDQALGHIDVIHTAFSELNGTATSPAWLRDKKLAGGGPLMDLGVYCVNTSRWLVDEDPVEVSAQAWKHDTSRFREVEEGVAFRMNFPSGLVVQGSSTYSSAMSSFLNVQGSKGWALLAPAFTFEHVRNLVGSASGRSICRTFKAVDEFAPQLDAFGTAIQTGAAVEADGIQGLRDLSIIAAIYEAARTQTTVRVKYEHSEKSAMVS
jgi:predicted dehydrogenase